MPIKSHNKLPNKISNDKSEEQLRAVFSNIPISLLSELKKYRTKNSLVRVQYRGRSGRRDSGGSVSIKNNAKKFTLYIHGRSDDFKYMLRDEHFKISKVQSDKIYELKQALKEQMDSIQSIHDGYSRQLKDKNEVINNLDKTNQTLKYQQADEVINLKHEISKLLKTIKTLSPYIKD